MGENEKDESKAKGGLARAKSLTPAQRKEIAIKAAAARWGEKLPVALHKGNFKKDFGIDVECYVLDDVQKTGAISQRGMGRAIGLLAGSGSAFVKFIGGKAIADLLGPELLEKLSKPLIFQGPPPGPGTPPFMVNGYDVTLLIDVCKAVVQAEADGTLPDRYANVAKRAHVILNASAKAGIKGLVYALAGYRPEAEEVIKAFKQFVQEEAREYEREFPPQLYAEWYRLYQLETPVRGRPWKAKHLTIDHVYHPLAKSNGKILKLTREQRESSENRANKLHQFLSEVGVKALRTHLGQVLGVARISKTSSEYEQHIHSLFGGQLSLL